MRAIIINAEDPAVTAAVEGGPPGGRREPYRSTGSRSTSRSWIWTPRASGAGHIESIHNRSVGKQGGPNAFKLWLFWTRNLGNLGKKFCYA
jgi:hypothetical protein